MPLAALVLIYPLAEVAVLILVGSRIGVWPVLGWLVATAVAGGWLIRMGGRQAASGLQAALRGSADPGQIAAGGAMTVLAGVLLIVPGLLSDAAALALLLPPVQRLVARRLLAGGVRGVRFGGAGMVWQTGTFGDTRQGSATVIDGEYEAIPGQTIAGEGGPGDPEGPGRSGG